MRDSKGLRTPSELHATQEKRRKVSTELLQEKTLLGLPEGGFDFVSLPSIPGRGLRFDSVSRSELEACQKTERR